MKPRYVFEKFFNFLPVFKWTPCESLTSFEESESSSKPLNDSLLVASLLTHPLLNAMFQSFFVVL